MEVIFRGIIFNIVGFFKYFKIMIIIRMYYYIICIKCFIIEVIDSIGSIYLILRLNIFNIYM